jgi:DNA-binding beta-propeller fold protein YncE
MIIMANKRTQTATMLLVLAGLLAGCTGLKLNPKDLDTQVVPLGFNAPVSFDDFAYDPDRDRVIIPAAETGALVLIDPKNMALQTISGFSREADASAPVAGTTSAAVAGGFLFGLDRATRSVKTVELATGEIVASTPLQADPDYIRYVAATGELWVSEPASNQIEILSMSEDSPPTLAATEPIPVADGPEGLIVDDRRGLVFTNRPDRSLTDVIQVMTHSVIKEWGNGCSQARGMAIDEADGYLFVACEEGKLVVMDINNEGNQVTSQNYGAKLDFVAFNPKLHHVYLPSSDSGIVAIFQLEWLPVTPGPADVGSRAGGSTPEWKLALRGLGTADTARNSKCVTTDNDNRIWLCDPDRGQVFFVEDTFRDSFTAP